MSTTTSERPVAELVAVAPNEYANISANDLQLMKICDSSETVFSLSKKHKILLVFLRQFGCCFCKEAILDLAELLPSLLQFNTVPVLVHQEPNDYATNIFKSYNSIAVEKLFHVEDPTGNTFYQIFGIETKEATLKEAIFDIAPRGAALTLTRGLTSNINVPKELCHRVSHNRKPGLFIVEQGKVVHQFYYPNVATRPDYIKVLMDLQNTSTMTEPTVDLEQVEDLKKIAQNLPTPEPVLIVKKKSIGCFGGYEPPEEKEETVQTVLSHPKKRKFLKVHMTKEHCAENIIFWEQVISYKNQLIASMRNYMAKQMIATFLEPDSFLQLNLSQSTIKQVKARYASDGAVTDLFDEVVVAVEVNIGDSFGRFVYTDLFKDMQKCK